MVRRNRNKNPSSEEEEVEVEEPAVNPCDFLTASVKCLISTTPHMNPLVREFYGSSVEARVVDGIEVNHTVDESGNPREMAYKPLTYTESIKMKSMGIVGVLAATPASAMSAIRSKLDEEMVERNLFLCGISLIAMGYLPSELTFMEKWTVYDRKKNLKHNPEKGIYFIRSTKPNNESVPLPIHSEFAPTAHYLNENPEVWEKIRKSFDFQKMYETHKSKVYGVALLDCKSFKQYMEKGGKFETICNYVNWLMEESDHVFKETIGGIIGNFPSQPNFELREIYPDLYLMKWKTIIECVKNQMETTLVHDNDNKGRGNPINEFIGGMINDMKRVNKADYFKNK